MRQNRRRGWGFLALLLVLALLFLNKWTATDRTQLTALERWWRDAVAPLQAGIASLTRGAVSVGERFTDWELLVEENRRLKQENAELKKKVLELREMEYQNVRLREALGFARQQGKSLDLLAANIIAREPNRWFSWAMLNRGSADGIKPGMAVVSTYGLVGRITEVTEHTATVTLLLDRRSAIGALIQGNRVPGVVEGAGERSDWLRMIYLPKDAPVFPRQEVITSGLGSDLPPGLPIGTITEVKPAGDGLFKYALIKPHADFLRLEEVFVVRGRR
ncbi:MULTISPECIES: rod shape-determining protein MreC [Carboxydocella]|uniref:Cell shape-determining protein MreC n=2 Tax=Carboxydocella TaxID=178898 RepID=A0A1T4S127_9FIRM|nr:MULTISPECIES: rod shape-determining protein MreC [Carboxydocella]AVX21135.1 rod shape-determining protein MreC [Carboxydocella thermautotrophica]SKA21872.1 rod shape-determining protein MreC [Carboxydocella sporoproducens DSM 16521]